MRLLISKFLQFLTELSAHDMITAGIIVSYFLFLYLTLKVLVTQQQQMADDIPSLFFFFFFFFFFIFRENNIALDKVLFSTKNYLYFSSFLTKTYVVGTH